MTKQNIVDSTNATGRHQRLHPPEGCHRTPHPTRTAQTIHQDPRVGEKDRRSHRRWHRDWQDNRHVRGAPGRFPRQRGNHPLLMHLGEVSLCQRHHGRNIEHLHGKFEELMSVNLLAPSNHGGRPPLAFYDSELPGEASNSAIHLLVRASMANTDVC